MFRSISNNLGTAPLAAAVATAVLLAAMAVFLIPAAPMATAEAQAATLHLATTDRLPVIDKKLACSLTSWPNYGSSCQFDLRASSRETRTVRTIALR